MSAPERLLVRAPNWIGDVVLSLPALRDLRRRFPAARLEVLARPWVGELYRAVPEVDAVVESRGHARPTSRRCAAATTSACCFPNSFGTALALWRAGMPERWGYATDGRGVLLTRRCRVPADVRGRSQVYYYRAMLEGLGLAVDGPPDASLACPEGWAGRGRALLGGDGPWIGVNPGAFYGTRQALASRALRGGRRPAWPAVPERASRSSARPPSGRSARRSPGSSGRPLASSAARRRSAIWWGC